MPQAVPALPIKNFLTLRAFGRSSLAEVIERSQQSYGKDAVLIHVHPPQGTAAPQMYFDVEKKILSVDSRIVRALPDNELIAYMVAHSGALEALRKMNEEERAVISRKSMLNHAAFFGGIGAFSSLASLLLIDRVHDSNLTRREILGFGLGVGTLTTIGGGWQGLTEADRKIQYIDSLMQRVEPCMSAYQQCVARAEAKVASIGQGRGFTSP